MNKLSNEYISQVKLLFPIMGKSERQYIRHLALTLEDSGADAESLEDLYAAFGTPEECVQLYFSNADTKYLMKRIKHSRIMKAALSVIAVCAVVLCIVYSIYMYRSYQIFAEEEAVSCETYIY